MSIKTNKIIAREFLFLAVSILLFVMTFIGTYFYNYSLNKKIYSISNTINILNRETDSLFARSMAYYGAIRIDENGIPSDKQNLVIKGYTKAGLPIFEKPKISATFQDTLNHDKAIKIHQKTESMTTLLRQKRLSILSLEDRTKVSLKVLALSILVLFVLRYFYYALK